MNLGKKIDILREEKRLKKKDLAKAAGISAPYLSAIINGSKTPTIETINLICNALDITINDLFSFIDNDSLPIPSHLKELIDSARLLTPEQVKALNEFLKTLE